jgi:hypothetical protein
VIGSGEACWEPASAGIRSEEAPELVRVDDVAAPLDPVDFDDGDQLAVTLLEHGIGRDVDHLELVAQTLCTASRAGPQRWHPGAENTTTEAIPQLPPGEIGEAELG